MSWKLITSAFASWLLALTVVIAEERPAATISSDIPADVSLPSNLPPTEQAIGFFDDFSWREFLAVSWPATACKRGTPLRCCQLGSPGYVATWDTWKRDFELFFSKGQRPSEWDSYYVVESPFDLTMSHRMSNSCKILGVAGWDANGRRISAYNQAAVGGDLAGTLIDQTSSYVVYEIAFNKVAYEFIRGLDGDATTWLYLGKNLPKTKPLPQPNSPPVSFPAGSVVIKAAWRQFGIPYHNHSVERYYTRATYMVDPSSGRCRTGCVGLIGLHIAHRTPSNREWIWSTFEHIDNITINAGIHPTLNNPAGSQAAGDPANNKVAQVVTSSIPPEICPPATQVVRVRQIHESTRKTNDDYHAHALVRSSIWRFYQLVMTQWATQPSANDGEFMTRFNENFPVAMGTPFPSDFTPQGSAIANVTMETKTLFQRSNSCMNCHHTPRLPVYNTGVSWTLAKRAFPAVAK